jgi:DNA-binding GntR family transcriptional regulator
MRHTHLTRQLSAQIAAYISSGNAPKGTRLVERTLAERLRVSRSPIRSALRMLEAEGIVGVRESGGYIVLRSNRNASSISVDVPIDEEFYMRIARDRFEGNLPDKVTENFLTRRYGFTRATLTNVLRRIAGEGWIDRLPGHGWVFLPTLTSMQSYKDSYRFRIIIEPAAILEPNFAINNRALEECREQQQALVDGKILRVAPSTLFDLNSHLHETIIECSRNSFFIDALKRVDKVRRLIEYKQTLDRKYAVVRCREHVALIDLLLAGKLQKASSFLLRHLSTVSVEKTQGLKASNSPEKGEISEMEGTRRN